jgi:hypothetical protein
LVFDLSDILISWYHSGFRIQSWKKETRKPNVSAVLAKEEYGHVVLESLWRCLGSEGLGLLSLLPVSYMIVGMLLHGCRGCCLAFSLGFVDGIEVD